MPFFDTTQPAALNLSWKLMLLGEASNLDQTGIKKYTDKYGLDGMGGMADADGKLYVDKDKTLEGWRPLGADKNPTDRASLQIEKLKILEKLNLVALDAKGDLNKIETKKLLAAAGIDESLLGDKGKNGKYVSIVDDPAQLLSANGFFRSFDPSGKILAPANAAEIKIFAKYENGKIASLSVVGLGSNSAADLVELDTIADLSLCRRYAHVLNGLCNLAKTAGLSGKDISFEGYSMGGGLTNSFYTLRKELAGGFFSDSLYFGFDSPVLSPGDGSVGLYNFAAENDPVTGLFNHGRFNQIATLKGFRETVANLRSPDISVLRNLGNILHILPSVMWHLGINLFANDMSTFLPAFLKDSKIQDVVAKVLKIDKKTFNDFINRYPEIFDQKKPVIQAGTNNLVIYDDAYHTQGVPGGGVNNAINSIANFFNVQLNSKAVASLGWLTHMTMVFSNPVARILSSGFYQQMDRNSVVVLSSLSKGGKSLQGKVWVEDKKTPTSDHYGAAAFILGTDENDLIRGGRGDDAIETLSGNDYIDLSSAAGLEHSKGTDMVAKWG